MPITVSGTQITFNDATTQNTAYPGVAGGGFTGMQVFNSPGTFTTPANTTKVLVTAVSGGGGGGGGTRAAFGNAYSGGEGGAGIVGQGIYSVSASSPYAVTIGSGGNTGNFGPNVGNAGGAGGATSFGNLLTCNGGNGGNGARNDANAPPNGPGSPGSSGNAPLATASATSVYSSTLLVSNSAGFPGGGGQSVDTNSGNPGNAGLPGRLIVYF